MALEDLYKEVILDHYKNPRNKRPMPDAGLTCSRNNPLCGDEITVFAHVEDGAVADVAFQGQGCSISQSSASMLTEAVKGKSVQDAERLTLEFRGMMAGEVEPDEDEFGDLVALKGVVKYPIRIKCAVLAWDVLQEALSGAGETDFWAPRAGAVASSRTMSSSLRIDTGYATQESVRGSAATEPRDRSAPAKRRARERVGESEGRSPSDQR